MPTRILVTGAATLLTLVFTSLLFVWTGRPGDAAAGDIERVSVDSLGAEADGFSGGADITPDGRFVAFDSEATNLVVGDTNNAQDVFVHDRQTGETTRVSVDSLGVEADAESRGASISADGRFVAFESDATGLVAGDTNGARDVFVHDRQTGDTARVSVDSLGGEAGADSLAARIGGDGRFVVFESDAADLVAADTNGFRDVFVHDRETGETTRVSVDSFGVEAESESRGASISANGRFVAFVSAAATLVVDDTNDELDVFVHDRESGETTRVSVDSLGGEGDDRSGSQPAITDDGRFVAFRSSATNLVPGDTNGVLDAFVHDRQTGETTRVSVDSLGGQGNDESHAPSISADGRLVSFLSEATNLVVGDTNNAQDVFVHDRQTGETTRVSVDSLGVEADAESRGASISADGRFVAFESDATGLVAGDTNGVRDVFVYDRGESLVFTQGDNDCDGDVDAVDALKGLQYVAAIPFQQEDGCPGLAGPLPAAAPAGEPPDVFGDVDCDGDVDAVDSLKILQHVAAIPFGQNEPCTDMGQPL